MAGQKRAARFLRPSAMGHRPSAPSQWQTPVPVGKPAIGVQFPDLQAWAWSQSGRQVFEALATAAHVVSFAQAVPSSHAVPTGAVPVGRQVRMPLVPSTSVNVSPHVPPGQPPPNAAQTGRQMPSDGLVVVKVAHDVPAPQSESCAHVLRQYDARSGVAEPEQNCPDSHESWPNDVPVHASPSLSPEPSVSDVTQAVSYCDPDAT